ncbi:MAG: hypothetical protein ABFD17_04920, partial [Anaerolineaceae bacterium]
MDEGWLLNLTPAAPTLPQGRAKEWRLRRPSSPSFRLWGNPNCLRWMRLKPAFPPGEPVTSQGRWGPLAVDEVQTSLPLGEGGPLAVDEGYVGNVYP